MSVRELIQELQKVIQQDLPVCTISGDPEGSYEVSEVSLIDEKNDPYICEHQRYVRIG